MNPDLLGAFVGRSAGELINALRLIHADVVLLDEPPGNLGSFSFRLSASVGTRWVRVSLWSGEGLLSKSANWNIAAIHAAIVYKIRIGNDCLCLCPKRTFVAVGQ